MVIIPSTVLTSVPSTKKYQQTELHFLKERRFADWEGNAGISAALVDAGTLEVAPARDGLLLLHEVTRTLATDWWTPASLPTKTESLVKTLVIKSLVKSLVTKSWVAKSWVAKAVVAKTLWPVSTEVKTLVAKAVVAETLRSVSTEARGPAPEIDGSLWLAPKDA